MNEIIPYIILIVLAASFVVMGRVVYAMIQVKKLLKEVERMNK